MKMTETGRNNGQCYRKTCISLVSGRGRGGEVDKGENGLCWVVRARLSARGKRTEHGLKIRTYLLPEPLVARLEE
jgi:hypothetical protein